MHSYEQADSVIMHQGTVSRNFLTSIALYTTRVHPCTIRVPNPSLLGQRPRSPFRSQPPSKFPPSPPPPPPTNFDFPL